MAKSSEKSREVMAWVFLIAVFGTAVCLVGPNRELLTQDDGWAYGRSVDYLLRTGSYHLDQWSAANMPVQIYMTAGLARVFGYSLILLRWTTLSLFACLTASFYLILRGGQSSRLQSLFLTCALISSPLLLMLAFTFMSDVQFLGWLFLSLFLYSHGLQRIDLRFILAGSIAAAAAIGTRQFGIALIGGWLAVMIFSRSVARPTWVVAATALALPCLAAIVQVNVGITAPNVTQAYRIAEQREFLSHSVVDFARELLWRIAIAFQYLAILLMPAMPIVLLAAVKIKVSIDINCRAAVITLLIAGTMAVALTASPSLTVRPTPVGHLPWPAMGLVWMWNTILSSHQRLRQLLDLLGFVCGTIIAFLTTKTVVRFETLTSWKSESLLVAGTGLSLIGLHLSYVQLNDTYIVAFVPFALLAFSPALRRAQLSDRWLGAGILACCGFLTLTATWMRHSYNEQETAWRQADDLLRRGVPAERINAPLHWSEYHGAFDQWIAAGMPGMRPPSALRAIGQDWFHDPFYSWLDARKHRSIIKR